MTDSLREQRRLCNGQLVYWSVSDSYITGLPDRMGVYRGLFWAFELKAEDGRLAERQKEWLADFHRAGGVAGVLRANSGAPGPMHGHLTLVGEAEPRILSGKRWLLDILEEAISKGVYKTDKSR